MRIDVIVNTTARRNAGQPNIVERLRRAGEGAAVVHGTATLAELEAAARAIAARGSDLVVLSGGDGSFMAGITALARAFGEGRLPRLSAAPRRHRRHRGAELGHHRRPAVSSSSASSATASACASSAAQPCASTGEIGPGDASRSASASSSAPASSPASSTSTTRAARGGYAGAARIVARIFVESFWGGALARRVLDPLPCTIEVDGRRLAPEAWSLVCAAVVRDLGIHMLVTYRAGEDPSRPHLVASPLSSRQLGPRAPLVLAGRSIGGPNHFDDLVHEFVVRFPGGPGPYVLDGDILRAGSARVGAGPEILVAAITPPW